MKIGETQVKEETRRGTRRREKNSLRSPPTELSDNSTNLELAVSLGVALSEIEAARGKTRGGKEGGREK